MTTFRFEYDFSSAVAPPPTSTQIRFDAAFPYTAVGLMWVRNVTNNGVDVFNALMNMATGSTLYLQDKNDHTLYVYLVTTGVPNGLEGYVEIPVAWQASGSYPLNNNQAVEFVITSPAPGVDPNPPPLATNALVSTDEAAAHLREVLDGMPADKLADLELKVAIASANVLDFLKDRGDPSWTSDTAPLVVKGATLQYLGMLWEHRGDDETSGSYGSDFDARAWEAMSRMLNRRRDPTLA